jgi:hypothetical protein
MLAVTADLNQSFGPETRAKHPPGQLAEDPRIAHDHLDPLV